MLNTKRKNVFLNKMQITTKTTGNTEDLKANEGVEKLKELVSATLICLFTTDRKEI